MVLYQFLLVPRQNCNKNSSLLELNETYCITILRLRCFVIICQSNMCEQRQVKRRKWYQNLIYPVKEIKNILYDIEVEDNKWNKELYITPFIENVQN